MERAERRGDIVVCIFTEPEFLSCDSEVARIELALLCKSRVEADVGCRVRNESPILQNNLGGETLGHVTMSYHNQIIDLSPGCYGLRAYG